jgi:hypothetical protein
LVLVKEPVAGACGSTPAMAAGIAGHVWTVEELLDEAGALE